MTEQQPARLSAYWAPRYWPTWLGLGLLWSLTRLPYRWLLGIGGALGSLSYYLAPRRRRIARTNIRLCFPELNAQQQERLVKQTLRATGMALLETPLSWWSSRRRLEHLCHIQGLEHVHQALQNGKGVILLSAHMTCMEIAGRLLSFHQPVQFVYKRAHNPLFEHMMRRARERHYQRAVETYDLRGMIRGLRDNRVCWYAADQDFGHKLSVFAPFMGVATATLTTPARLAQMTGAALVPYFPRRLAGGRGYELCIQPALEDFPSADPIADAARINALIGAHVRTAPEQYLWIHRRFKTRPPGEPPLYT